MSEPQEAIQDLMKRWGFEEPEARAYYHLQKAHLLFWDIEEAETTETGLEYAATAIFPHFVALQNELTHRVWRREHAEASPE